MIAISAAPNENRFGPLPLVVGITGHRSLRPEDIPALENRVREVLTELQQKYPHTPLTILSPLAEGADRLVARVGLSCGVRLVVPLPLPREEYERDFATPESRSEFHELIAAADKCFDLPLVQGNTPENIKNSGEHRTAQFALVGAYLVQHCQVLLALWDGADAEQQLTGGTADVVNFRLNGTPPQFVPEQSPLDTPDVGPITHILTPRSTHPLPGGELFARRELLPEGYDAKYFEHILERIETFNQDAAQLDAKLAAERVKSKSYLLPEATEKQLPAPLQSTLNGYAVADTLALHFAQLTNRTMRRIFVWVFIAAACFNIYHSLPMTPPAPAKQAEVTTSVRLAATETSSYGVGGDTKAQSSSVWSKIPWFLLFFLACSAYCNWMLHRPAREGDYQNKHQDYRALAEGLRVQMFWSLSGLQHEAADYYLGKQRGELEWIRRALRASHLSGTPDTQWAQLQGLSLTRQHWVEDQKKYFGHKAHQEHHELERDEQRIGWLLRISISISLLLLLILTLAAIWPHPSVVALKYWVKDFWVYGFIMIAIVLSAVSAGLLHGYNQQRARAEHAKQFNRMSVLFANASARLEALQKSGDTAQSQHLIEALGKEALAENADWVLLHRERPLEVPHAG